MPRLWEAKQLGDRLSWGTGEEMRVGQIDPLDAFKILAWAVAFARLIIMCLIVDLFVFILHRVC